MTIRTGPQQPWPAERLEGGGAPPAAQRATIPAGVAKSEVESPAALPPTPATETWPLGRAGSPLMLTSATVTCQRPSAVAPLTPTPALAATSTSEQPPLPVMRAAAPLVRAQSVRAAMVRPVSACASARRAACSGLALFVGVAPTSGSRLA